MSEILMIRSAGEPSWVNTIVYENGIKLDRVLSFEYTIKVEDGASVKLEMVDENNTDHTKIRYYRESRGDKVIMIYFNNWRQYLEDLRNEDSILLRR